MADNKKKVEREYGERLEKMPSKIIHVIKFNRIKFAKPHFWEDTRKVVYVTGIIKAIVVAIWLMTTALVVVTSIMNERNSQWDIHSFDQSGEVKWINIKKMK